MSDELTLAQLYGLVPAAEEEDLLDELRDERQQREVAARLAEFARLDGAAPAAEPQEPDEGAAPRRSARDAEHEALHLLAVELDARLVFPPPEGR